MFLCAWYFKRIIPPLYLSLPMCLFSPFFFLFLSPVIFYFSIEHTQKQTHLPLLLVIVTVYKSVHVPHSGCRGLWVADTCQGLICHLCAEMEMSRSDTTCQRWRWRLTSLRRLLNQLHGSHWRWLGNNNYRLWSFQMKLICDAVMSHSLWHLSCDAVDVAGEMFRVSVRHFLFDHFKLQINVYFFCCIYPSIRSSKCLMPDSITFQRSNNQLFLL